MAPTTADAKSFTLPAIEPAARENGILSYLRATIQNPLTIVPASAYTDDVTIVRLFGTRIGCISAPALLEEILIKRPQDFPKSVVDERVFRPAFGNSLLIADGDDWRWKRRLAAPYFAPAALAKAVPDMAAPFAALATRCADAGTASTVDVAEAMTEATLDVIGRTLFSSPDARSTAAISDAITDYLAPISWQIMFASMKLPAWLPHPGLIQIRRARRRMRDEVLALITAHRASATAYRDICTDLMRATDPETGRLLADEDLVDMLLTLIAAGHETSANALAWALYCLAVQPELQEELRAEARDALGGRPVEARHLPELAKIEAFAKEAMRLFPPAPLIARKTTKHETFGAYSFPPGTTLFLPIYAIHRHQNLWREPDRFDIGRHLGEAAKRIPRTAYMPFGAGPRICIGGAFAMMEITTALATLLTSLRFVPAAATRCEPIQRITLRPKGGLRLTVQALTP